MALVEAPIETVDVVVRESFPPQYGVQILAGLPSGCAKPHSHELTRNGTTLTIRVLNETLVGVACTLIYGTYELNIDLGTDFQSGVEYTLQVNDETHDFTAQ